MNDCECIGAVLTGPVSRSNDVVLAHRALRDGYGDLAGFEAAIQKDRQDLLEAQTGFAFVSGGQADWLDLLRPLAKTWNGFSHRETQGEDAVGPVTRYLRTNTFYRRPHVNAKISCGGHELAQFLPPVQNGVAWVLGPYSFTAMVDDGFYGDAEGMACDYAAAVAESVPALRAQGYRCVLWLEPVVGYRQSKNEFTAPKWLASAYPKIQNVTAGVHFPLADGAALLSDVSDATVDFVGLDGFFTDPKNVRTEKDVLWGAVDGARFFVESAAQIRKSLEFFSRNAEFSGRYLVGPNDRLFDVPFHVGLEKTRALYGGCR